MRILSLALSVLFASMFVTSGSGCIAVQTHTIADVVVETARGHDHHSYEAWESHNISAIAIACLITATFYGGACWAYLATPFDEHEAAAISAAKREMEALGGCAHVVSARVERVSWQTGPRSSRLSTLRGRRFTADEIERLCKGQAPVVIEQGPAPAEEPRHLEPKPHIETFDPAEP